MALVVMLGRAGRIDCPACGYGFMNRRRKRCPRCEVWLVYEGDSFIREQGDRVFLWLADLRVWSEVLV